MRPIRWLLMLVLVIAAIAALALPGPVGTTVNRVSEAQLAALDAGNPDIDFVTEHSRTDWFASRYLHRVVIEPDTVARLSADLIASDLFADQPAVAIDTRVHHGPVALGALGFTWKAIVPAWSRSRSTLAIDNGRTRIALPVVIDTAIGLTGRHTSRITATAFDTGWKMERLRLAASAAEMELTTNSRGALDALTAVASDVAVAADVRELEAGRLDVQIRQRDGTVTALVASELALRDADTAYVFDSIDARLGVSDDRTALRADVVQRVPTATTTRADLELSGADAAWRQRWFAAYRRYGTFDLERALIELAALGGALTVHSLEGTVEGHAYTLSGELTFRPAANETIEGVFAVASGSAVLSIDDGLVRRLARSDAPMTWLGYLERDGERYRLDATLGDGVLDLNGAAFPLGGRRQSDDGQGGNSPTR